MKAIAIIIATSFLWFSTQLTAEDSTVEISVNEIRPPELDEALTQIHAGKPEMAVALYDSVLERYEQKYTKGIFLCADDAADALKSIVVSINPVKPVGITVLGPVWCEALWGKAFALIDLNRSFEAEPLLVRAVSMAPTNAHYTNELAELYKSRREWQRAFDTFERAFRRTSRDKNATDSKVAARSLRGIGFALIELSNLDEAEARFRESLEYQPDYPGALSELEYIARKKAVGAEK